MVQDFVAAIYGWLLSTTDAVRQLLPILILAFVAWAALWLLYRRYDNEEIALWKPAAKRYANVAFRAIALALLVLILSGTIVQAKKLVGARRMALEQATASRRHEPQLSGVVQYAPSVAFLQDKTYTRT